MTPTTRTVLAVGTAALLLAVAVPAPASAAHPAPALVVGLDDDGSATVTLRSTFDLSTDAEREAFTDLRESQSARDETRTRFRERMARVAAAAADETDRSMSVTAGRVDLSTTDDGVGVVRVSVEWAGLAEVRDDRLVVTTPFADGYDPDRRLVIAGPEGYGAVEATPTPTARDGATLRWAPGTDLDGFTVTYAPADGDGDGGGGSGVAAPGFGIPVALVALLAAAAVARRP